MPRITTYAVQKSFIACQIIVKTPHVAVLHRCLLWCTKYTETRLLLQKCYESYQKPHSVRVCSQSTSKINTSPIIINLYFQSFNIYAASPVRLYRSACGTSCASIPCNHLLMCRLVVTDHFFSVRT